MNCKKKIKMVKQSICFQAVFLFPQNSDVSPHPLPLPLPLLLNPKVGNLP